MKSNNTFQNNHVLLLKRRSFFIFANLFKSHLAEFNWILISAYAFNLLWYHTYVVTGKVHCILGGVKILLAL